MAIRHTPVRQLLLLQCHVFADPDALLEDKTETILSLRLKNDLKIESANTPDRVTDTVRHLPGPKKPPSMHDGRGLLILHARTDV